MPVTLVTRGEKPHNSDTYLAQGGIIYVGKGDTPALMAEDALRAGAGHCNPAAVNVANAARANRQSVGCHYQE